MAASASTRDLGAARYLLLTTYRRDGSAVATPVWVVSDGAALGVWTATGSGKVKRIRNNAAVTVAACTARGRPLGPSATGRAEVLDAGGTGRIRRLVMRKYRLAGPVVVTLSRLRRGAQGTVGLRIDVG